MATVEQIDGNLLVRGAMTVSGSVMVSTGAIANSHVSSSAGIEASKYTRHQAITTELFATTDIVTNKVHLLHIMHAPGTLRKVSSVCATPTTAVDRTVIVGLERYNGTTFDNMLSTGITLSSTSAAYVTENSSVVLMALANGDAMYLTTTVAGTSGTQARGLAVTVVLEEEYS